MRALSSFSRRQQFSIHFAVFASLGTASVLASTQTSTWTGTGGNTDWNTAGNWSPSGIPNNGTNGFTDYDVIIGAPSPTTLNVSPTIDDLTISAGGVLDMQFSNTLTVDGPTLTDNGTIVVNSNTGGAISELLFDGNTLLTGSGTITFQQPGSDAQVTTGTGDMLTQDVNHTMAGYGEIAAALTNNGTVNANVNNQTLLLQTNAMTNNATFEATNGGLLNISGITVTQGTNGTITAANASTVTLSNSTISNGTLSSSGTGTIQISGTTTISGVTNGAAIDVPFNQILDVVGNLVDNGTIVVNSNTGGAIATLSFNGGTLSGSGTIVMQQGGTNDQLNGSLTQALGHTIQGYGQINATLSNSGIVNANVNNQTLLLQTNAMTNNATFEATGGGTLNINGITVTQTGGTITAGTASAVVLTNSTISGGTITSAASTAVPPASNNAGFVQISGTTTISSVTNSATIDVPFNQTLDVVGNLIDNGTIVVNSNTGGAIATLSFNGGTLSGSGTIVMQQGGTNDQLNGSLTQALGHTIQGYGQINATLINNSTVNANVNNQTLFVESPAVTNTSLMEATSGGVLQFDNAVPVNNVGGNITANGGGVTLANGTSITGGTINAVSPNVISIATFNNTAGYSANLNGVTLSAGTQVNIPFSNTLSITGSTLTDNGTIVVNSNTGGAVAALVFNSNTLLTGSGTITLQQPGSNAQVTTGTGDTLTQDVNHTMAGYGEIAAALTNNGTVDANVNNRTLLLQTNAMTNNATFEATNGGLLNISGITVTQGTNGTITAANASTVTLSNSTISNGTLSSSGTGTIQISGTTTISSVTNSATIDIPDDQTLNVTGNLIDNGTIVVNSNTGGATSTLSFNGGTLSGSGTIVMQQGGANDQLNGSLTQALGHTIQGYGQINATFTNNGTVNANVNNQTLLLQTNGMSNNGTFEATGGGILNINDITVTQTGDGGNGQISAGASSVVSITGGATILGGNIGAGTGTVNVISGNFNGVTIASGGQVSVPSSDTLALVSTNLTNNGALNVTGSVTGGKLSGSGTLTINSSGRLTLPSGSGLSAQAALTVSGGTLDITNNSFAINYGVSNVSPLATIVADIKAGYNGGHWTGTGITSSTAAADNLHAIGYADSTTPAVSGQILLKYTLYGDANLDGVVDGDDYTLIDNGFNNRLTGWRNGDFNYDGVVNGDDYTLIDNAFNNQSIVATAAVEMVSIDTAQIFDSSSSAVPEPGTIGLLAIGIFGLTDRRRRTAYGQRANRMKPS